MFAIHWVSAPATWKITTVQAGITVLVAVLCTLGVFVFSRFCWQLSGRHLARNEHVTLSSLISINTVGEASDAFFLLRHRIFHPRYWRILSQSIIVTLLTVATIISGPIAKASTRVGSVVDQISAPGLLSNQGFNSLAWAYVAWNQTATSLNDAGFPYDQLLDFVPSPTVPWVYRSGEWNSSWTMQCNRTVNQQATLFDTGDCTNIYTELPGINDFFPENNFTESWNSYSGLYVNGTRMSDVLLMMGGWTWDGYDDTTEITHNMTVSFLSLHLHGLQKANKTYAGTGCSFGYGPVDEADYNMVQCQLKRQDNIPNAYDVAFPDHGDRSTLVAAYVANFIARMSTQSVTGADVTGVTADELIRFYQAYLAVKDTYRQQPVTRSISVERSVVQISDTFIGVIGALALLDLIGVIYFFWFMIMHWQVVLETPESKLDWAVQSILGGNTLNQTPGKSSGSRWSVVAAPTDDSLHHRKSDKMRAYFENARYGGAGAEENIPLQSDMSTPGTVPMVPTNDYTPPAINDCTPPATSDYATPSHYMYNISPFEAQFAAQDTSYGSGHQRNGSYGLGVQAPQDSVYMPRAGRGYQRLS